jgi:hypothetical protein
VSLFKSIKGGADKLADGAEKMLGDAAERKARRDHGERLTLTPTEYMFIQGVACIPGDKPIMDDRRLHDDILLEAADALSFFRRLDRLLDEYEKEHGLDAAFKDEDNHDDEGGVSLDSIVDDFLAAQKGETDVFKGWAEGIRGQVIELVANYPLLEMREVRITSDEEQLKLSRHIYNTALKRRWG